MTKDMLSLQRFFLGIVFFVVLTACGKQTPSHYDILAFPQYPHELQLANTKLGDELRIAHKLLPGEKLFFEGTVPDGTCIMFAFGEEALNTFTEKRKVTVIVGENNGEQKQYIYKLESPNMWTDKMLDVSKYTGRSISISFSISHPHLISQKAGNFFITPPQFVHLKKPNQKNMVLISIDTLRADHLGCYGYHRDTTPFLDEFSKRSLLFENCITPAPWTLPAHVSLFTGLYSSTHKVIDDGFGALPSILPPTIPQDIKTIPEILKENGYITQAITSHLYVSDQFGFERGFHSFLYKQDYTAEEVTRQALQWIDVHAGGLPFFLFLHYFDCHDPYMPPSDFSNLFDSDYSGNITGELRWLEKFGTSVDISARDLERLIALYDGEIRYVDTALKKLVEGLHNKNLIDKTIIIITSDHGEEFKEHGSLRHGKTLFDEILKVPLLLYLPGKEESRRISKQVSLVDIFPTILELLNIPPKYKIQGKSLISDGIDENLDRVVFSETSRYDAFKACVRTNEYKYIIDNSFFGAEERLFYLPQDPAEQKNLLLDKHKNLVRKAHEMKNILLNTLSLQRIEHISLRYLPVKNEELTTSITATITTNGHFSYVDALGGWPENSVYINEGKNNLSITYKNLLSLQKVGINFAVEPHNASVTFSGITINGMQHDIIAYGIDSSQCINNKPFAYDDLLKTLAIDPPTLIYQDNIFCIFKTISLIPKAVLFGSATWETKPIDDKTREKLRALGYVW